MLRGRLSRLDVNVYLAASAFDKQRFRLFAPVRFAVACIALSSSGIGAILSMCSSISSRSTAAQSSITSRVRSASRREACFNCVRRALVFLGRGRFIVVLISIAAVIDGVERDGRSGNVVAKAVHTRADAPRSVSRLHIHEFFDILPTRYVQWISFQNGQELIKYVRKVGMFLGEPLQTSIEGSRRQNAEAGRHVRCVYELLLSSPSALP